MAADEKMWIQAPRAGLEHPQAGPSIGIQDGSHPAPCASFHSIYDGTAIMRITLVGSRHFGVTTLNMLRQHGVDIVRVVVHDGEDRLAATARAAGIEVVVQADPSAWPPPRSLREPT